jgi:hypothetical protein
VGSSYRAGQAARAGIDPGHLLIGLDPDDDVAAVETAIDGL